MVKHYHKWQLGFLCLCILAFPLVGMGATFQVTDTADAIPSIPGTLRAAIEKSESNPGPDVIEFLIDGGTIQLVAPLPNLTDGALRIGSGRTTGSFPSSNGIFVSGGGTVLRAFEILSSDNVISELDYVGFAGPEVILIGQTNAPVVNNLITANVFGSADPTLRNLGAAIRIQSGVDGQLPNRTRIFNNRLEGNASGVVIEGNFNGASTVDQWTWIWGNGFNVSELDNAGVGTGRPILAADAGKVHISNNRFLGPGEGIRLEAGCHHSRVVHNTIGSRFDGLSLTCDGYSGPAIEILASDQVKIFENRILCSTTGIEANSTAERLVIEQNKIGQAGEAITTDGVVLDSTQSALVRNNRIEGGGGYGIHNPLPLTNVGFQLVCNEIWDQALGAIELQTSSPLPPQLTGATPIAVSGTHSNASSTVIELFADDADQGRTFQGARVNNNGDLNFRQLIPVVDLTVTKNGTDAEIKFDRTVPLNHTATAIVGSPASTSEHALPITASADGLVFDLIRGDIANLTFGFAGGIILGDVDCLANGIEPSPGPTTPLVDEAIPEPGQGFFYLARKRVVGADNQIGTYDPAICQTELEAWNGPREVVTGDCPAN